MKLCVFSGCTKYGSEVQAFKDRGHVVETCGIEGEVTFLQDIRAFHPTKHYDFMTFHPPCTEFSKINWRLGKCKDRNPDLSIVEACFRIISEARPEYWIIENPTGCLRHFIGHPNYVIKYGDYGHYCQKSTDLWGNLPMLLFYTNNTVEKGVHNSTAFTNGSQDSDDRAMVPYLFSLALCQSIESALQGTMQKLITEVPALDTRKAVRS